MPFGSSAKKELRPIGKSGIATSAASALVLSRSIGSKEAPCVPRPSLGPAPGGLWKGVRIEAVYALGGDCVLCLSFGSVVNFEGEAIVNAANNSCLGGGGVDGAISAKGGPELLEARRALPLVPGSATTRCPTGEARLTVGGRLKSKFCIHAVGPRYTDDLAAGDMLLLKAYGSAMTCAQSQKCTSVAFSLLSAGVFRGKQTLVKVLEKAVEGICQNTYPELTEVHLVAFTSDELAKLKAICGEMLQSTDATPALASQLGADAIDMMKGKTLKAATRTAKPSEGVMIASAFAADSPE